MVYLILFGTFAIALLASWRVKSNFNRFARIPSGSGITGAQAAQQILGSAGITGVEVMPVPGTLTDHYDPINRRLALSEPVYYGDSIASLGVAAHECGHALQHQAAYAPLHARMGFVKVQGFASQIVMWLPLIGGGMGLMAPRSMFLMMAVGWGIIMLFNLITLPVEFDASRRAKALLGQLGIIRTPEEAAGVGRVLDAAGWTYVAAFLTSLAWLLFYLLPLLLGGRRSDH
ncbi:MAG: zinc metallopeptidase [Verrucomicrobiales bacterium]